MAASSELLDYSKSRAILIGVSNYHDPSYPVITAAANSMRAMRDILTDRDLCGWPRDRVILFPDPENGGRFAQQLRRIAEQTTGVLLLYFVGHGTITRRGELCLTLTDTDADGAEYTGLEYAKIKDILIDSPAQIKVAILDCCYAGRAIEALGNAEEQVADSTDIRGVYTLTAADHTAHVVPFDQQGTACTSFTAEFVDLVSAGMVGGPPTLNLNLIYSQLLNRLVAQNLPRPNQRGTDTADRYPFARNASTGAPRARKITAPARPVLYDPRPVGSGQASLESSRALSSQGRLPAEVPGLSWPDPDSVRSFADYTTTLHRTWIRAGAPSSEEIERRTGGLVGATEAKVLLGDDPGWGKSELQNSLLVLEACGLTEELIKKWSAAGARALKSAPEVKKKEGVAQKRIERQSSYNRNWHLRYSAFLSIAVPIYCILGSLISLMPDHLDFGGGNWLAFSVSVLAFAISPLWGMIVVIPYSMYFYGAGHRIAVAAAWFSCMITFAAGWFLLQRINGISPIDHTIWRWLGWRF